MASKKTKKAKNSKKKEDLEVKQLLKMIENAPAHKLLRGLEDSTLRVSNLAQSIAKKLDKEERFAVSVLLISAVAACRRFSLFLKVENDKPPVS